MDSGSCGELSKLMLRGYMSISQWFNAKIHVLTIFCDFFPEKKPLKLLELVVNTLSFVTTWFLHLNLYLCKRKNHFHALGLDERSYHRVRWQKWCQMFLHTNGAHTRTTSTMWDAKCFVQVEMTNICSNESWACETNLRRMVKICHKFLNAILIPEGKQKNTCKPLLEY